MRRAVLINAKEVLDLRSTLFEASESDGPEKQPFIEKALAYLDSIIVRAELDS